MLGLSLSLRAATPVKGGGIDLDAFMASQADGFWFDFTKTDRLFQENVGPTPANDPGEVIGLAMSQRAWEGKTLAELLAGQTDLGGSGFTLSTTGGTATATESPSGTLNLTGDASNNSANADKAYTTVVGRTYRIAFTTSGATPFLRAGTAQGNTDVLAESAYAAGTYQIYFTAQSTTTWVRFRRAAAFTAVVSAVSVKEVPGKHGTQATPNFKPKYQAGGGAGFDSVDDNLLTSYTAGSGANFLIAKVTVPASLSGDQVIAGSGSSPNRFFLGINTSGRIVGGVGADSVTTILGTNDLRGQTIVVALSCDGATVRLFEGTDQVYSAAQNGSHVSGSPLRIGSLNTSGGSATLFFGGTIHSLVAGREFIDLATFRKIAAKL